VSEKNLVTVRGSVEFRDAVMRLTSGGIEGVYAQEHGTNEPTYRIIHGPDHPAITTGDLFRSHFAPVRMEDFASALGAAGDMAPRVDVFNL
jgi:hypothetical protein